MLQLPETTSKLVAKLEAYGCKFSNNRRHLCITHKNTTFEIRINLEGRFCVVKPLSKTLRFNAFEDVLLFIYLKEGFHNKKMQIPNNTVIVYDSVGSMSTKI